MFAAKEQGEPFVARDGALIFELFRHIKGAIKNLSIAVGYLKARQKALPHYHETSEEIYYVLCGCGKVRVGDAVIKIKRAEAVYIPPNTVHALENTSYFREMKVLAVCSPTYSDSDIFFI